MEEIDWNTAPEWANLVVDVNGYLFYLEHNHKGRVTYAQRVDGCGWRVTSSDNHVWWDSEVVDVRREAVPLPGTTTTRVEWPKDAPAWANFVSQGLDGRRCYLDHMVSGRAVRCQFFGSKTVGYSFNHHGWDIAPIVSSRHYVENCALAARNKFIKQAYELHNSTSPKYNVYGAMFDAGCRFPAE